MYTVKRSIRNPIISPLQIHPWEDFAAFNWSVVSDNKKNPTVHCVYRAMAKPDLVPENKIYISSIGYAKSKDYINYTDRTQLIKPEFEWERYGCEDPRITRLNGKYYIFYTALSAFPFMYYGIKVACAITKDFKHIEAKHLVTPFNAKAMSLFPAKINGKMACLLTVNTDNKKRVAKIALAQFEKESDIWNPLYWKDWYKNLHKHILHVRRVVTDHVEIGSVPVKTKDGWLLIYSHIQHYLTNNKIFGIEALLLDLKNPQKVIAKTRHPLMIPEESYEKHGQISNVIFPSGSIIKGDDLLIFYGAADTTSCMAQVNLKNLIKGMQYKERHYYALRYNKNPIISPIPEHAWENNATFNPAAVDIDNKIHIVYRAMSTDNTSTMGYAASKDGLTISERLSSPIYVPRENSEQKKIPNGNSGCEDPRITRIGNTLYMTYTAYNGEEVPRVALSNISVKNFLEHRWSWSEPILITPENIDDKDACILPEKIKGQYMFIHRINSHICYDMINSLEITPEENIKGIRLLAPRYGMWDSQKIGLAGVPIKSRKGWILFYHGVSEGCHYSLGAALLELDNPANVISRTDEAILEPEKRYEKEGQVQNVVFPCGHILRGDTIYHYYGGGDSVIGVATTKLSRLLEMLS